MKLADSEFDEICSTQTAKGSAPITNDINDKEDSVEEMEKIVSEFDEIPIPQATQGLRSVTKNTNDKDDSDERIELIAGGFDEICSTRATKGSRSVKFAKISELTTNNDKEEEAMLENGIRNDIKFEEVMVGNNMDYPVNVFEEVDELREQM